MYQRYHFLMKYFQYNESQKESATHMSSSQPKGLSIRYPIGSFSYNSAQVIPGYGVPPNRKPDCKRGLMF